MKRPVFPCRRNTGLRRRQINLLPLLGNPWHPPVVQSRFNLTMEEHETATKSNRQQTFTSFRISSELLSIRMTESFSIEHAPKALIEEASGG